MYHTAGVKPVRSVIFFLSEFFGDDLASDGRIRPVRQTMDIDTIISKISRYDTGTLCSDGVGPVRRASPTRLQPTCLLYTSDAADE